MYFLIVFFKQKTSYEMRISDWSSDVCSSDLQHKHVRPAPKMPVRVCAGMIGDNARYSERPQQNFRVARLQKLVRRGLRPRLQRIDFSDRQMLPVFGKIAKQPVKLPCHRTVGKAVAFQIGRTWGRERGIQYG